MTANKKFNIKVKNLSAKKTTKEKNSSLKNSKDDIFDLPDIDVKKSEEMYIENSLNAIKNKSKNIDELPEIKTNKKKPRSFTFRLYRNIVIFFIIAVLGIISLVAYYSMSSLTIRVKLKQEKISDKISVDIIDNDESIADTDFKIKGIIEQFEANKKEKFAATGEKIVGEEVSGTVKIINNYIQNQPLVATTRLLTPDGTLFRTKNTVNVPAGGSIDVEIYADKPSKDLTVKTTKFSIPGLWTGLQDKIYAESVGEIKYRNKVEKYIQQSDVDMAVNKIKNDLIDESKNLAEDKFLGYAKVIYNVDDNVNKIDLSAKVGDRVDEFTVSIKTKVNAVAFNDDKIFILAKNKITNELDKSYNLSGINKNFICSLTEINIESKTAKTSCNFEVMTEAKRGDEIIDTGMIAGMTKDQIDSYLKGVDRISSYSLEFEPSFIHNAPRLADRIKIIVTE